MIEALMEENSIDRELAIFLLESTYFSSAKHALGFRKATGEDGKIIHKYL